MSARGMTWDAAADRKLFLCVLKTQNISVDYESVAKCMSTDDVPCTPSAIQNRIHKLKVMAKATGDNKSGGDEQGTPKSKSAPRKRGASACDRETPTKMRNGTNGKVSKQTDDDEDVSPKPIKKEELGDGDEA